MSRLSPNEIAEAITLLRQLHIPHREGDRVVAALRRLSAYDTGGSSAAAGVICGEAGVGKTSALLALMSEHPVIARNPADMRRIAFAKITGGSTTYRSFALDLLRAFGDFEPRPRATAFELLADLIARIRQQQTILLAIDEAQLFISSKNRRVLFDVLEWLKAFLNESPCSVVLIGAPELLDCLKANPSFARRVEEVVVVPPYDWNVRDDRNELRKLYAGFDRSIPHLRPAGLDEPEMAARLYLACPGRVGLAKRLLIKGTQLALERGADKLTLALLAEAFGYIDPEAANRQNPFVVRPDRPKK